MTPTEQIDALARIRAWLREIEYNPANPYPLRYMAHRVESEALAQEDLIAQREERGTAIQGFDFNALVAGLSRPIIRGTEP